MWFILFVVCVEILMLVLVKIVLDLFDFDFDDIVDLVVELDLVGIVVINIMVLCDGLIILGVDWLGFGGILGLLLV